MLSFYCELFTSIPPGLDVAGGRPGAQPNYGSICNRGVARSPYRPVAVAPEAEVERRRRDDRGAEGAEGGMVWGGGTCPPLYGGEVDLRSPENFSIFELKKAS